MGEKRATVRDVAARAGVSPGTVSKALNGTGQIARETRARILAAAEEIDFRPNALARSVFERRSYTVGLITTDSFERFSVPVMLGAEDALGAGRISVFLCDSRDDPIREQHYVDVLLGRRVDGFIVTGRTSNERAPLEVSADVPVVYALTPSARAGDCSILVDDVAAGRLAGEHLIRLGRRRVAHLTGSEWFDASRRRAAGLASALADGGLSLAVPPLFGDWTEAWGRQATHMLLRSAPDVDAIYCGNDILARGVADSLRELGRRVPEDVALIGTDNWEFIAHGARPPLTSVDLGLPAVGRLAAQRLLDAIAGNPHAGREHVPCHLVVRASTDDAAPPT
ncbi:LacI family DNA-binding transcriptional regulator [Tenggerimyces flavus]|uniref:LacI family DNA-binding transcriptional regulator n=1 Tax=Tenggerimyces flavus TaxID=1708749 RepID=A0ABV7YEE4_9ACTN|nr:LacI family DNA-binding transcriptional regulator [Tenggerimyces flavus]MBM7787822.1 LacI family transcriptional regulator [Tenggerimyces flavus]